MWPSILFISTSSLVSTAAILLPTSFTSVPHVVFPFYILNNDMGTEALRLRP